MAEGSFTIGSKVFSTVRPEAEIEKLSLLMITFPKVPRSFGRTMSLRRTFLEPY